MPPRPQICCVCGKTRKGHKKPFGKSCTQGVANCSKDSKLKFKPVGKLCSKCKRPIKGHKLPKGSKCLLTPIMTEEEHEKRKKIKRKASNSKHYQGGYRGVITG